MNLCMSSPHRRRRRRCAGQDIYALMCLLLLVCARQVQGLTASTAGEVFAKPLSKAADKSRPFPPISRPAFRRALKHDNNNNDKNDDNTNNSNNNNNDKTPSQPSSGTQNLNATGLTMMLGGVQPLDDNSRTTWAAVTNTYIADAITKSVGKSTAVQVSVTLVSQNPPYTGSTRRELDDTPAVYGVRGRALTSVPVEQELTYDVGISIQSNAGYDANRFVADAFSTDKQKSAYLDNLKATGDPAFTNANSFSTNQASSKASKKNVAMGIIVAFVMVGIACLGIVLFVLRGNRNSSSEVEQIEGKVGTDTDNSSLVEDRAPSDITDEFPPDSDVGDVASVYWQGSVASTAWRTEADMPNRNLADYPPTLSGQAGDSVDCSLLCEDGDTPATPHGKPFEIHCGPQKAL